MLVTSFVHTIDDKGRLFVPAKWRDDLGSTFMVLKGTKKCLVGMPMQRWTVFTEKLAALPSMDEEVQDYIRHTSAWTTMVELDKQGRILLPSKFREFADLTDSVTLVGMMNQIEIWDTANFDNDDKMIKDNYNTYLRKMAQLGI